MYYLKKLKYQAIFEIPFINILIPWSTIQVQNTRNSDHRTMVQFPKLHIPPSLYAKYLMPVDLIGADLGSIDLRAEAGLFPSFDCIVPAIAFAVLFGILRKILHQYLFRPMAISTMALKLDPQENDAEIEKGLNFKLRDKGAQMENIKAYCMKQKRNEIDVIRYVAVRNRNRTNESKITKFCEAIWRFIFYLVFCFIGYFVLFVPETVPWVLDTKEHWTNFVEYTWNDVIALYCYAQLGCYIHQLMWTEVTRSDAAEMILHHVITIFLLMFSFLASFTRIGCSILLVHDFADIFLESAKCLNYIAKNNKNMKWLTKVCDGIFVCFVVAFAVTRLYIYPKYLVGSLLYDAPAVYGGVWFGWYVYVVLLCGLQCLHIFWFILIGRMVYRLFMKGEVEGDVRSDDEFETEPEESSVPASSTSSVAPSSDSTTTQRKKKNFPAAR